ncbi:hypothetical protein B0T10DRAFT_409288 [Thelonectria olida]|uniref:Uncharacterized protein n=1 Tax=Thelonectria olida TaxID=1576542 RepID=A0A9P8VYQ6_9HYPO|nr:hypothetical protein B0T10DRAFT_409288 [Thelonectria olida]
MSHRGKSFLHLPAEIRNLIYDLAFVPVEHANLLNPIPTVYTKEAAPLLYVHPAITAELNQRLYRDNFSLVLPVQEPSEFAKGRGLTSETLERCLKETSPLMKQRCEKLIVEASQTQVPDEDYDYWYHNADFPTRLIPALLSIRSELPALKEVEFIFWFGNWVASVREWKEHLKRLAEQWNAHIGQELKDVASESSRPTETSLHVTVQFNLFDYSDPDAGDGGSNWIQLWDRFADETEDSNSALALTFSAIDLAWGDEANGTFEGREFEPKGWAHTYVNTMSIKDRDELLHKYYYLTTTCKPLYVEVGEGRG